MFWYPRGPCRSKQALYRQAALLQQVPKHSHSARCPAERLLERLAKAAVKFAPKFDDRYHADDFTRIIDERAETRTHGIAAQKTPNHARRLTGGVRKLYVT